MAKGGDVHGWDGDTGQVGDALTWAVLALAGLLLARAALTALLRTAGRLPGPLGRAAARLGRTLRPGLLRRLTAAVLGLGVPDVGSVAALPPASAQVADPAVARTTVAGLVARSPMPTILTAAAATTQRARTTPPAAVVAPGDSLWDIARRHLPPGASSAQIARAWPRWYAANRAEIGPDPALLRPGMRLRDPDRRSTGTSAHEHDRPSATAADPGAVARSLDPDRR